MNGTKQTKTTGTGTDGMLVCDAKYGLLRLTNLPANWLKVRIAMIFSMTDTTGFNNSPVAENVTTVTNSFANDFLFGMTNGSPLGVSGGRYLGVGTANSTAVYSATNGSTVWAIAGNSAASSGLAVGTCRGDGTTVTKPSSVSSTIFDMGLPNGTTGFACGLGFELDVSVSGSLSMNRILTAKMTDTSGSGLATLFGGSYSAFGATLTGGWWVTGSTSVGLQYIFARLPFTNNRLRIHNIGYLQTG